MCICSRMFLQTRPHTENALAERFQTGMNPQPGGKFSAPSPLFLASTDGVLSTAGDSIHQEWSGFTFSAANELLQALVRRLSSVLFSGVSLSFSSLQPNSPQRSGFKWVHARALLSLKICSYSQPTGSPFLFGLVFCWAWISKSPCLHNAGLPWTRTPLPQESSSLKGFSIHPSSSPQKGEPIVVKLPLLTSFKNSIISFHLHKYVDSFTVHFSPCRLIALKIKFYSSSSWQISFFWTNIFNLIL